jgi:methylmalonyl-CoA carboxyltransferase large subunit
MGLLLLPLGIFAGWVAGAAMSRRMVRREVQRLESLIESKNGKAAAVPAPAPAAALAAQPAPKPPEQEAVEEVSPETIMILTAAVAAFLGKRARIRGARLVRTAPSSAWAQQGRVFVQASHNLGVMHGR